MKMIVIILLSITAIVCFILAFGNLVIRFQFAREVEELFLSSKNSSVEVFIYDQLEGLPDPV